MKLKLFHFALLTCLVNINVSAETGTWTDENGTTWTFLYDSSDLEKTAMLYGDQSIERDPITGNYLYTTPCISGTIPTDIAIPKTVYVDGASYIVTAIENYAFYGCSTLTSITIPECVTFIGQYVFAGCSSLTSVTIPEYVTYIGFDAFKDCASLKSISIPTCIQRIAYQAFDGCFSLSEVHITDLAAWLQITFDSGASNPLSYAHHLYLDGKEITELVIPEGVTSIGNYAFDGCTSLTSVSIPKGVTSIGWLAFAWCSSLTSITIPEGVTTIGTSVFYNCSGLTSICIPKGVTSIEECAFKMCSSLTSITIPEGVTNIEGEAFGSCSNLTSITIPEGVKTIGFSAFQNCSNLTSIRIPESVTSIGDDAFDGCSSLTTIKLGIRTPIEIGWAALGYLNYSEAVLYVPRGSKALYKAADGWNRFGAIVECDYVDVEEPSIAVGGSNTVEIGLNNFDTDLVAFQMDLTLPEGISLDKTGCSLSSRITDEEQELTIGKLENGAYRLTSSSLSLTPISGTEGTLLTLKLTATEDCDDGQATISNIRFSTAGSKRVDMPDETFDIDILHKFKLTYKLEDEVYKTSDVIETTPLTLEAEPTKDGYTFGGWSELPETMPGKDVEITGRFYLYGDVNTDEEVDVVDVVDIARFVVATPSGKFREKLADLNKDNSANLGDAVVLVNHIAGDVNFVKAMAAPNDMIENGDALSLTKTGKTLALNLTNRRAYTAFQFDLYVDDDANVTRMALNAQRKQEHQLLYNKVENGHYRVAVLSTSNRTFNGNDGELLSFVMDAEPSADTEIRNIRFFDTKGNAYAFDAIGIGLETGLKVMQDAASKAQGVIYDLQGRKLTKVQRGVNIVNGKTLIIKK